MVECHAQAMPLGHAACCRCVGHVKGMFHKPQNGKGGGSAHPIPPPPTWKALSCSLEPPIHSSQTCCQESPFNTPPATPWHPPASSLYKPDACLSGWECGRWLQPLLATLPLASAAPPPTPEQRRGLSCCSWKEADLEPCLPCEQMCLCLSWTEETCWVLRASVALSAPHST